MEIALLAHDRKKELMVQFCIAYCGILAGHSICATNTTGRLVAEATGLKVTNYLSCKQGGDQQIGARIAYNEIDLVLFFCDPDLGDFQTDVNDMRDFAISTTCPLHQMLQPQRSLYRDLNAVTLIGAIS